MSISPQHLRWGPVDDKPPGVTVLETDEFIPWEILAEELERKLLRQVEGLTLPLKFVFEDHEGKPNWKLRIHNERGEELAGIWIGPDPEVPGAPFDGLVRVGKSFSPPRIWSVFQRYSNGSYILLPPRRLVGEVTGFNPRSSLG